MANKNNIISTVEVIKTIWFFVKKYKISLLLYVFVYYLLRDTVYVIGKNYVYQIIINKLTTKSFQMDKDFIIIIMYVLTTSIGMLMSAIAVKSDYNIHVLLKEDIKKYYYQNVLRNSISFFNNNMVGTLNSKIKSISQGMIEISSTFVDALSTGLTAVILSFIFLQINYLLSLILIFWLIYYTSSTIYFMNKLGKKTSEVSEVENRCYGEISDSFVNSLNVKSFSRENYEKYLLKKGIISIIKKKSEYYKTWFFVKILDFIGITLVVFASTYITINMVIKGEIDVGKSIFIIGSSSTVLFWLRSLAKSFLRISELLGEIGNSLLIIDNKPEIIDEKTARNIILKEPPKIEFEDVYFRYNKNSQYVFEKFNLLIQPAQKIGLVGATGSGKSTFVNLILRFYDINQGNIKINGFDIKNDFTQKSLRKNISYISQEPILFHRTIRENILYGNIHATEQEMIEASKKAYCYDFIVELENGFDTLVGERGVRLSGGQKQRIAIARAILKNSSILILDEATSALDSITENYIQKALEHLMKDKTVLVIAHRLSTLNNMDRIIVLNKGKIVEDGSKDDLIQQNGIFKKMWDMQKNGII